MDQNQTSSAADVDRQPAQNGVEDPCSICTETITNPLTASTCGHKFCSDCFQPWLDINNTCPNCRAILPEGTVPQPAPYFEYANEGPNFGTDRGTRRDSLPRLRNQLARRAMRDLTQDLRSLNETMMDLFEDLFPSPNARSLMRNIIRTRDTIMFEIDMFSTTHEEGPRLDNLTLEEVRTFHATIRRIRYRVRDLEAPIENLWRNVDQRRRTKDTRRRHRLLDRWDVLCDEMTRMARQRANVSTRGPAT